MSSNNRLKMARKPRERRYIAEFMMHQWPEGNWQLNVEMGPIPQEYVDRYGLGRAAALFRPTRPRVDAVKWDPRYYYLIEAKVRELKTGFGDLVYYRSLVPRTPDLPFYTRQEVKCLLVVPWMLEWVKENASALNIDVVVFHQPWIDDYVKERQHYFTAEYRMERARRVRLRELLGVD